jgi:secondary thiamine-phosphate synthase enzyme
MGLSGSVCEEAKVIFELEVHSQSKADFVDITPQLRDCVRESQLQDAICAVYVPHTTAGLIINENWDPSVKTDMLRTFDRLVPLQANYQHAEGNSAAHIKACLVGSSETLLVDGGNLVLGSWQGVFLAEFDGPRRRRVLVRLIPDAQ